jgi:energy-coupling factor transport system permease protein
MHEAMGFYRPGGGWLHRLNPYPKLLLVLWGVLAPFVLPTAAIPVLIVAYLVAGMSAGLGAPYLRAAVLAPMAIVLPIVLINGFFYPGSHDVILAIGPLALTREGLTFGLPIAGRVLAAFGITVAFVTSTRPDDLMETLVQRGTDPRLAFVVLSAIQAIPRMLDKAGRILEAQQARGLAATGSPATRVRAVVPLLGPLIIGSLIDVRERSLALEARAFSSGLPRTAYRIVGMREVDRRVARIAAIALLLLPVVIVLRVLGVSRVLGG